MKRLKDSVFRHLEGMSDKWRNSFGNVPHAFIMIIWGQSGNGKSSFIMMLIREIMHLGTILYVTLEEGISATTQDNLNRTFEADEYYTNIRFADHTATYENLFAYLKKRNTERFIIIDSVQYWHIDYDKYCRLKEAFPRKSFIFISHASGKLPDGKTADKIRYDATIKIFVSQFVAFVKSRAGGNKPYLIWEAGAIAHYGKKPLAKILKGIEESGSKTKRIKKSQPAKAEETN